MEYYIYGIPVFLTETLQGGVNIPDFCQEVEEILPARLLTGIDVVYIGEFPELAGRNATFADGAIYMTAQEPTSFDMVENFVHEVAHALETIHGMDIYTDDLQQEFLAKRERLEHLLEAEGFHIDPALYTSMEYSQKFDEFLAHTVGYPILVSLTMGLFVSPYGATSLQEYFANGFEKYFLDNPRAVKEISPVLYRKIENIINEDT